MQKYEGKINSAFELYCPEVSKETKIGQAYILKQKFENILLSSITTTPKPPPRRFLVIREVLTIRQMMCQGFDLISHRTHPQQTFYHKAR